MASKVTNSASRCAGSSLPLQQRLDRAGYSVTAADGLLFQVALELAAVGIRITLQYGDAVEKERAANAAAAATHVSSLTSAWAGSIITIPCYLGLHTRGTL